MAPMKIAGTSWQIVQNNAYKYIETTQERQQLISKITKQTTELTKEGN